MRKFFPILISWICMNAARSQSFNPDSLRNLLSKTKPDTNALHLMEDLAQGYAFSHPDSTYYFGRQAFLLASHLGDKPSEAYDLINMSIGLRKMGNYPKALGYALQSLKISEQMKSPDYISIAIIEICSIYYFQMDGKNSIAYAFRILDLDNGKTNFNDQVSLYRRIAGGYELMHMYDSCLFYQLKSYQAAIKNNDEQQIVFCYENLADGYFDLHQDSIALIYYRLAFPYFVTHQVGEGTCEAAQYLAQIFERKNKPDSALWYGQLSLSVAQSSMLTSRQSEASDFLAAFYKKRHQSDSALKYLELSVALKDSLFNKEKVQEMENLTFDENNRQQELQDEKKKEHESSVRNLQLIAIAIFIPVFFLFVLFLGRIKVKARLVEFLAIVDLLLFFEFITDLVFPYISDWTNDRPIGEMLILVLIAAALEPLNFGFENWVKKHLVDKPAVIPVLVENPSVDDSMQGNQLSNFS
jgi:hypothetical protein